MGLKPFVTFENSIQWTFISVFGALILPVVCPFRSQIGYGFDHEWEVFTGSKNDPENPHQVAKVCYTAAIVFAALTLLCGCQIGVHSRVAKGGNIHL
ncbi:hypothetical protein FRC14_007661 [Serendipita sp. 396]|nr:hypothetical protein FRC14_007661 [Serendipita sp. 396]